MEKPCFKSQKTQKQALKVKITAYNTLMNRTKKV